MRWNEIEDIAEALEEHYPDEEVEDIRPQDLHDLIITLNEFDDDTAKPSDRILEAVREAWLEMRG